MRGIEVRIRHENDEPSQSVVLAEVPFTEPALDEVIRLLRLWSVAIGDSTTEDVYANFQVQDGRVWFDVMVVTT